MQPLKRNKTLRPKLHTTKLGYLPYSKLGTMTGPYFIGAL